MKIGLLAGLALLLCSCAPSGDDLPAAQSPADLLAADRAFAAAAKVAGLESAYRSFLAVDAVQLPDGGLPLAGKDAILANVAQLVEGSDFLLLWAPEDAQVSASGELGYTWGYYELEATAEDGERFVSDGKYANVWRKAADGQWRVILDISNPNDSLFEEALEFDFGNDSSEADQF